MTLKWNCEYGGCYKEQLPDWVMLNGCFGATTVSVSDIDGVVYQNGRCLFLEKKYEGGNLTDPSRRMINALVKQGNSFIVFWSTESNGSNLSSMRVFGIPGFTSDRMEASLLAFRRVVNAWWKSVYSGKCE